jgi:hypothetical protein
MRKFLTLALLFGAALSGQDSEEVIWGRQSSCPIPGMPGTICSGAYYWEGVNVAIRNEGAPAYLITVTYRDSEGEKQKLVPIEASQSRYTFTIEKLAHERGIKIIGVEVEPVF